MNDDTNRIFSGGEAALAYALCGERLFAGDASFLNGNPSVVPIFVSQLFQSLEMSIKHAGIESKLFTLDEAREKQRGRGHGIKELAALAVERLGGEPFDPLVMAMTCCNSADIRSAVIIREMICGDKFEKTRESYRSRRLGYAEVSEGEFQILDPIEEWIASVKQTALKLDATIQILRQWQASDSKSKHFAVWFSER